MKKSNKYILVKDAKFKKVISYNFDESLEILKRKDKTRIGVIKFYDEKIVSQVIKKSIDYRFKKLLELIASLQESDTDPSSGLIFCLDEAAKFKQEIINKYSSFLKKSQIEFINKKIELIEKEVKNKLIAYRLMYSPMFQNVDEEEMEEERTRSR